MQSVVSFKDLWVVALIHKMWPEGSITSYAGEANGFSWLTEIEQVKPTQLVKVRGIGFGVVYRVHVLGTYKHSKFLVHFNSTNSANWYCYDDIEPISNAAIPAGTRVKSLVGPMTGTVTGSEKETNTYIVLTDKSHEKCDRVRYAYPIEELTFIPQYQTIMGLKPYQTYQLGQVIFMFVPTAQEGQYAMKLAVDLMKDPETWPIIRTVHAGATSIKGFPNLKDAAPIEYQLF